MSRFIRRGVSKIMFAPTLANKNAVTRAEITSAIDLTPEIADVAGWMLENQSVATPNLASTFDATIPGTDSAADSSLTFYEDTDTEVIDALLPKGTEGNILIFRKGDKPASPSLDVFPIRVGSKGSELSIGNDPARMVVSCSITEEPGLDTVIPAAGP